MPYASLMCGSTLSYSVHEWEKLYTKLPKEAKRADGSRGLKMEVD